MPRVSILLAALVAMLSTAIGLYVYHEMNRDVVRGVVLEGIFWPADGSPPLRLFESDLSLDNVCVTLRARTITVKSSPPFSYMGGKTIWGAGEVDEPVLAIQEVRKSIDFEPNRDDRACRLPPLRRVKGTLATADIETSDFRPVNAKERWWTSALAGAGDVQFGPRQKTRPGLMDESYACVDALGLVGPLGLYGHLGVSDRQLIIVRTLWSAPTMSRDQTSCAFPD